MATKKQNCWEFMKCGRELGGEQVAKLGICRAATEESFNEINSGKNGGRICFAVAGTISDGEGYGTYAKKFASCKDCNFFKTL